MDTIDLIEIDDVRLASDFSSAPVGPLLQFCMNGSSIVGVKTIFIFGTIRREHALVVCGSWAGDLIDHTDISGPCVLLQDVAGLAVVSAPVKPERSIFNPRKGYIYKSDHLKEVYFMWAQVPNQTPAMVGWVCISSADASLALGSFHPSLDPSKLIFVSESATLTRKRDIFLH